MSLVKYLDGQNIILMAHSIRFPIIDKTGKLTTKRFRNLGAGELVPVLHASGVASKLHITDDTVLIFSNIDFDPRVREVLGSFVEARKKSQNKKPNLMQVHVATSASGGSAYRVTMSDGSTMIMPIEGIALPMGVPKAPTLNTNTIVFTGVTLRPEAYANLPIVFERKGTSDEPDFLTKVSLADVSHHSEVIAAVALGSVDKDFFTGSKDSALLSKEGLAEVNRRIQAWNFRLKYTNVNALPSELRSIHRCSGVFY
jgi:hypothetical protein